MSQTMENNCGESLANKSIFGNIQQSTSFQFHCIVPVIKKKFQCLLAMFSQRN